MFRIQSELKVQWYSKRHSEQDLIPFTALYTTCTVPYAPNIMCTTLSKFINYIYLFKTSAAFNIIIFIQILYLSLVCVFVPFGASLRIVLRIHYLLTKRGKYKKLINIFGDNYHFSLFSSISLSW